MCNVDTFWQGNRNEMKRLEIEYAVNLNNCAMCAKNLCVVSDVVFESGWQLEIEYKGKVGGHERQRKTKRDDAERFGFYIVNFLYIHEIEGYERGVFLHSLRGNHLKA